MILRIKKNPSRASKLKRNHFSHISVTEVFLEAVPTTFVLTSIWIFGYFYYHQNRNTRGLYTNLFGASFGGFTTVVFFLTYATSIMSAAFGVSR